MDVQPTYYTQDAEMHEIVINIRKPSTEKRGEGKSSIFYTKTSSVSKTIETKSYTTHLKPFIEKKDNEEHLWLKNLEQKAKLAAELISKGESNTDIIGVITSSLNQNKTLVEDLKNAIEAHKESMKNVSDKNNESEIKGPNISLLSLFNALKFYPVISTLPKEMVSQYIDANAHIVGMVIGDNNNKININFMSTGELLFRHIDKTTGRVRISGSAFFGKDENIKDMKKIKKLISFVKI